jgi:transcriptional regulator with XRE-family HTH domain
MGKARNSGCFDPDILAAVRELRTYRMVMGISMKELARRMKVWDTALGAWEREARMPDMIDLRLWAEALGYTIKVTLELPG